MIEQRKLRLVRPHGDYICLAISTSQNRSTRFFTTEEQAQHLSNRLQSFAKGNFGNEVVLIEDEPS